MMRKSLDITLREPHQEVLHCLHYLHHFTPFYKNFWHKYGTLRSCENCLKSIDREKYREEI